MERGLREIRKIEISIPPCMAQVAALGKGVLKAAANSAGNAISDEVREQAPNMTSASTAITA